MSLIAAGEVFRPKPPAATPLLARPGVRAAVGVLGLVVGAAAAVLVATSGHLVHPLSYGLQIAVMVVGTVGVALYWAVARPGNRIALLLLAYAVAAAGESLQAATNPLLHSIGELSDPTLTLLFYYLVFAFPEGHLVGALEKVLFAGVVCVLLVSFLPWFFFSPLVAGGFPLAGCNASCPSNALMIADRPAIAAGFGTTELYLAALLNAVITVGLCYRLASASGPRRRALLPVYVPALLVTIPLGVFKAASTGLINLTPKSVDTIGWFLTAGETLLSFGFLLAIVQAMIFAGVVLKTILGRLGREEGAAHLRQLVAEALDDPPLELAFEVDRGSGSFVDSRGDLIDPTPARPGRSATAVERHGETVAYIVHDAALETDPELVQAAGQAVLLALVSGRLESELQSKIDELRISRGRIVAGGEEERRKIERDLHDGAQQRLVAIQIKLALLSERVEEPELSSALAELGEDTTAAIDDLRRLAHGIYPTVLRERGLGDGLRSLARTAPIRVELVESGIGRCAPAVEAAIYFCSLEAIQNAVKHAGPGAHVTITLDRLGNDVYFAVFDDGAGFDPNNWSDGIGLVSMRDRIGALGGELELVSAPGAGTQIRATVPDEAAVHPVLP